MCSPVLRDASSDFASHEETYKRSEWALVLRAPGALSACDQCCGAYLFLPSHPPPPHPHSFVLFFSTATASHAHWGWLGHGIRRAPSSRDPLTCPHLTGKWFKGHPCTLLQHYPLPAPESRGWSSSVGLGWKREVACLLVAKLHPKAGPAPVDVYATLGGGR